MSTCERVSLLDAARELGMNPQGLREYMKRGLIDIGLSFQIQKGLDSATSLCGRNLIGSWEKKRRCVLWNRRKSTSFMSCWKKKERKKDTESGFDAEDGRSLELENRR